MWLLLLLAPSPRAWVWFAVVVLVLGSVADALGLI
jgi:hypothetical protein